MSFLKLSYCVYDTASVDFDNFHPPIVPPETSALAREHPSSIARLAAFFPSEPKRARKD